MPNRLAQETSPYLLQHKDNPVDWYPWSEEALTKAKTDDKPILLSIGYSACHWCHVMEHESFEDEETADLMNREFVSIKVDREERPDIDNLYMTAVQAMTGHGGWPLNVFLTPDGVPFYGGTYWPTEDRQGMPSFTKVLESVAEAYRERREGVEENAGRLRAYLNEATKATPAPGDLDPGILDQAAKALARSFDGEHGGFGGAPKFPQAAVLEFLLRYRRRTGDDRAGSMAAQTLDAMAEGGLYDQIGGGFHRYAVDAIWLVPHFEKMLYDNAQLARVYLDAFRAFGHERYRRVATETLAYVAREMIAPEGGFAATQDADSEGEEGKFYVWTPEEIDAVLGPEDGRLVREYYGVTRRGNFEGKSILHIQREPRFVAAEMETPVERLLAALDRGKKELYEARSKRIWPGRDDKVLLAWNGMMLRAFAEGARVVDRADFREIGERVASFLLDRLRQDGRLLRTYKDGRAKLAGYLEDYANLADGLISLYEATFERRWIVAASEVVESMLVEFADPASPLLFDTGLSGETLISRPRDLQDGATPSGNAVAAGVLLRLGLMTGREAYNERAAGMLRAMARPMAEHPTAFGRWLSALDAYLATPREVALAGERTDPELQALASAVFARYEPNAIIGYVDSSEPPIEDLLPFLSHRPIKNGQATAYLCEHFACLPPVNDPADLTIQLEQGTGVTWRDF